MAKITLQIVGNVADIQQRIAAVKQDLASIGKEPIHITVDTNGLNALEKTAIRALNAQARMREAENALALARERTEQETQRRLTSENNLAIQMQRTATAEEQTRRANIQLTTEIERQNTEAARLETQQERTNTEMQRTETQAERTQTELVRLERAQYRAGDAAQHHANALQNIGNYIVGFLTVRAMSTLRNALSESLKTLKDVDSALVTVRKTTDLSEEEIKSLADETYRLASAYGRTADELMNLNADFARAGFKENLSQMTELAALLENVGDIEGDVASKFLLAANAAWQLNGDYAALMEIIDGMNNVTNQAAVDMEGLTTGLTVAGSVFSSAGESAQTFTALLGTGIALTQRSGSEIARGLRTALMNVRQIKGELEDGEIIDEESISNAAKALHSVGVSVSENGELRKFSDVMGDLATKWNDLTTAEQSYVAESIAGKRQANVVLAILQNYGEYQRQLGIYAEGAGSALKENELYLDSWEAKSNQLKSTWTEMVANLVDTREVKNALDTLTNLVEGLDTVAGRTVITIGAIGAALLSVAQMAATNPVGLAVLGVAAAAGGVVALIGKAKHEREKQEKLLKESRAQLDEMQTLLSDSGATGGITINGGSTSDSDWRESIYNQAQQTAQERAEGLVRMAQVRTNMARIEGQIRDILAPITNGERQSLTQNEIWRLEQRQDLWHQYNDELTQLEKTDAEYAEALRTVLNLIGDYVPGLEDMVDETEDSEETTLSLTEQIEAQQAALEALNTEIDNTQSALSTITAAQEEYNETGGLSVDTIQDLLALDKEYLDALIDENGQINLNSEAVSELIDGKNVLLDKLVAEATATYAVEHAQELLAKQNGEVADSADTMASNISSAAETTMKLGISAMAAAAGVKSLGAVLAEEGLDAGLQGGFFTQWWSDVMDYYDKASSLVSNTGAGGSGWTPKSTGSKSGGSSSSVKDEELERRKAVVNLLESELALMQERGDSEEDQIAKMRKIQEALHDEAEYLCSINADETEINALSKEWWTYQNKIADLYEDIAEKQRQILEDMKAAENEQYQSLIDNLSNAKEIADENLEIEEKKLAVLEAQANLINAQNERTIRYWNAQTGQWEWSANQQDVQAAQEALANANKELQEAQLNKRINDLKRDQARAAAVWDSRMALPASTQEAIMGAMSQGSLSWEQASGIVSGNASASATPLITSSGAQYSGNFGTVYQFGNLTISEAQANSLTIGQLATMLGIYLPTQASTY